MHIRLAYVFAIFVLLQTSEVLAGLEEGIAAYNKSDYGLAIREFSPLAEQGNANAQNYLGWLYANDRGVAKNEATAVIWYTKAAMPRHEPNAKNWKNPYHPQIYQKPRKCLRSGKLA